MKPANVLIHNGDTALVSDFGFAKQAKVTNTVVGTPVTCAPELLGSNGQLKYDSKVDIWAIGVTFYYMLFGKYPWLPTTR